jgi:hypothetical protein
MAQWKDHHVEKLPHLKSFDEMVALAFEVIDDGEGHAVMVAGPISTGGLGSREKNTARLTEVVDRLIDEGHPVFNQVPFEGKMKEFIAGFEGGYPMPILEEFYLPLHQSGRIKKFFFIPGWESSFGASWEHDRAHELGIEIIYLD